MWSKPRGAAGGSEMGRRPGVPGLKSRRPPPIPSIMSIDAAIGRIQQIVTMQQQLLDPATAATATAASAGTAASAATPTAGDTSFAAALTNAQTATGGASVGDAP